MFKDILKTKEQRKHDTKIKEGRRLIALAKENGIYVPDSYQPSEDRYRIYPGMWTGWYTSFDKRVEIARRGLEGKGLTH